MLSKFCDCNMKSTTSKFMLNAMHIEELAASSQNYSALYEEDDPDTIRVEPRGARKRTHQESGLDLDEQIERLPTQTADVTVKTCAASENVPYRFQSSSGMMTPTNSTVSKEDQGRDEGTAINQTSTEADQMVLLPLGTLRALQNEGRADKYVRNVKNTAKQLEPYGDALNARLASDETETNASDGGDDRSTQVDLEDLAARKVAVRRVRRLARDYHSGKERAHLEFMADIVGVRNKSKVDSRLVQVASRLQRLTMMAVTPRSQPSNDSRSRDTSLCQATPP
jgi:hypothetical protein